MSQRPVNRIGVVQGAESKDPSSAITGIWFRLDRGGPQWTPYEKLSPSGRKEWDACEEILSNLSSGRYLYVSGRLDGLPSGLQTFTVHQEHPGLVGMCRLAGKNELHHVLTHNTGKWLGYLVTEESLSPEEGIRIAAQHSASGAMDKNVFAWCPAAYCGIEEGDDHNWFDLGCHARDAPNILAIIRSAFEAHSIEMAS